jgi:5-methylcytosine-specific restriction endonuclease McrA
MGEGGVMGLTSKRKARIRERLYQDQEGYCWLCHKPIKHPAQMTLDHVRPLAKGGSNRIENLKLAHKWCNNSRMDNPPPVLKLRKCMAVTDQ